MVTFLKDEQEASRALHELMQESETRFIRWNNVAFRVRDVVSIEASEREGETDVVLNVNSLDPIVIATISEEDGKSRRSIALELITEVMRYLALPVEEDLGAFIDLASSVAKIRVRI